AKRRETLRCMLIREIFLLGSNRRVTHWIQTIKGGEFWFTLALVAFQEGTASVVPSDSLPLLSAWIKKWDGTEAIPPIVTSHFCLLSPAVKLLPRRTCCAFYTRPTGILGNRSMALTAIWNMGFFWIGLWESFATDAPMR